jgi:hypothetical protein
MRALWFAVLCVSLASVSSAQTVAPADQPAVPPVVKFAGTVTGVQGAVPLTFALYAEQTGGVPLWTEQQTVVVSAEGRYVVTLGAATAGGLPETLFAAGEAHWVGVAPDGQAEQPRVLLVSVPYALKASDATTVEGKPLSAFVLAGTTTGVGADGLTYVNTQALKTGLQAAGTPGQTGNMGTQYYIGMFQADGTDLGNSVMYQQNSTNYIGVNTTSPLAPLHVSAPLAPAAFFDVYSPVLTALPVVYRAARGTPTAPSAVQTGDIIGGLAVRGFGASVFSPGGRGQVVFKAAENWTDSAHGTYLSILTTPIGTTSMVERVHVNANGYLGLGASSPTFPIDARLLYGATAAAFGYGGNNPIFLIPNEPHVGFNLYFASGYKYGSTGPAGYLAFNQVTSGGFTFATAPSGTADTVASMSPRLTITSAGAVGIGTTTPAANALLDVEGGNINTNGYVTASGGTSTFTDSSQGGTGVQGFADNGTDAWGVYGESGQGIGVFGQSTSGTGVLGQVTSGTGVTGGNFEVIGGTTGKALDTSVNDVETMYVDATGVHGGPGLTGTPVAYAAINSDGSTGAASSNISCVAGGTAGEYYYDCTIAGYSYLTWVAVVTAVNLSEHPIIAISSTGGTNVLRVRLFDLYSGTATLVQNAFHVVVFKP